MKNITEYNKKTCIFKTVEEMNDDIKAAIDPTANINVCLDGVEFTKTFADFKEPYTDDISEEEIFSKLAEYYDVKEITSIHIDDCDMAGVWICYKDSPVVETESIIRCKNCQYKGETQESFSVEPYCELHKRVVRPNCFCSFAKPY